MATTKKAKLDLEADDVQALADAAVADLHEVQVQLEKVCSRFQGFVAF